jgi:hypothetical protein
MMGRHKIDSTVMHAVHHVTRLLGMGLLQALYSVSGTPKPSSGTTPKPVQTIQVKGQAGQTVHFTRGAGDC